MADVGRATNGNRPFSHPLPERFTRMTFEAKLMRCVAVLSEENGLDLFFAHDPQELSMITKFNKVVRRGSGSTRQPVGDTSRKRNDCLTGRTIK